MATSAAPEPNPASIFEALNAYQRSFALKGAIELEVFTHIADGATTSAEIASRSNASARGIRILCDYLTIAGLLTKEGEHYGLTPDSGAFLSKRSPAYMGTVANFLLTDEQLTNYRDMAAVVRKGGVVQSAEGNMSTENTVWVEFARSMVPMVAMYARMVAPIVAEPGKKMKVLDIAAGHGMFGIEVARHNPAARIVAVDWRNVLEVALENAGAAGVTERFQFIAGSAFDVSLGSGYDVVLLPNFLHHFDAGTNVSLLKRIRAAMNPDGLLATLEFIPNEDRVTPPAPASFALMMLGSTASGDAYTFREYDRMFREAGFGESRKVEFGPAPEQLILTEV
jgi:2-polyprenyl-3-methyl-5-hydroxy-6-metoxy-1,4-benzoquinol methylase